MQQALTIFIFVAIGAVIIVLGMGFWNLFRGGDSNFSQKLMRARVAIQFVAVLALMAAAFFFSPKG